MAEFVPPPEALPTLDRWWGSLRQPQAELPPAVVHPSSARLGSQSWDADVVIAGGTLGILLGAALAKRGWRVILLERGILRGREQEWNTSHQELQVLLELELLTPPEWEAVQVTHYPRGRIGFGEGPHWWVEGVLNVGVDPVSLLEFLKQHFLAWGGPSVGADCLSKCHRSPRWDLPPDHQGTDPCSTAGGCYGASLPPRGPGSPRAAAR